MARKIRTIANVEVIDIGDKGQAIGRCPDGRVVMVDQAVPGDVVNVERSLTLQDRLGGHFVMGHVDTVATVSGLEDTEEFRNLQFGGLSVEDMKYIFKKGSVSVNGVSLTINERHTDGFSVMLIPHTLERTNLDGLKPGAKVNIEFDLIVSDRSLCRFV